MALTVSFRDVRKRGGNGATPALVKPRCGKCFTENMTARIWIPNGDTLHKVYLEKCLQTGDDSTCSPSEKKHQTEKQDNRRETGLKATKVSPLM